MIRTAVLATPAGALSTADQPVVVAQTGQVSVWLWIPFLWLFTVSTRSLSAWLSRANQGGQLIDPDLSGSPVDRALLTFLIVVGLIVLATRMSRLKTLLAKNKTLVILALYIALSMIWSNFPAITIRRAVRSIGTIVMVLTVLTEADPLAAIAALLRRVYFIHIPLSIITIKYFRNIGVAYTGDGIEEMWTGLAIHKNNLGQVAMCSGLFAVWQILRNWKEKKFSADLVLLLMTLWILRGSKNSHSSTAILGFAIGTLVLLALQYVKQRIPHAKRLVMAWTLAAVIIGPFVYLGFTVANSGPMDMVLEATGRDATLTGRTGLWTDIVTNASKSPIVGVGYGAFWVGSMGYEMYPLPNWSAVTPGWRPGQGHNGYVDVYIDLGIVGIGLVLVIILLAFGNSVRLLGTEFEYARIRLALLVSLVMNNMTESSMLKGTHSLWFLFALVAVNSPIVETAQQAVRGVATKLQPIRGLAARPGRLASPRPAQQLRRL